MFCPACGKNIDDNEALFCPECGCALNSSAAEVKGQNVFPHDISNVWPSWKLEKQLGKGSYGVVYSAVRKDYSFESRAAIKIISIPQSTAEIDSLRSEGFDKESTRKYLKAVVDEFIGEIDVMESLKGLPNIVSVEDYTVVERTDDIGWNIYIRMELLTPFSDVLKERQLSEDEIVSLGCDICTALEFCSKKNIIHRDIKPENIFINEFGSFKLGDFGIAKKLENMTGALSQKGTFNYMAPEVAKSADYDAGVHLYSLGLVLYRLLNGNKLLSGAQKDFEDIIYELESGIANVFSTSSFTSGGKKLTEYYADVDYDREYKGDTQVIADGYFNESKFRSSPYFDIRIDGIYLINEKF